MDRYEERRTAEEKGLNAGIEIGIAKGLADGEYKKAVTIAKEMLLDGMTVEKITKFTGLTAEQIEGLSQV